VPFTLDVLEKTGKYKLKIHKIHKLNTTQKEADNAKYSKTKLP